MKWKARVRKVKPIFALPGIHKASGRAKAPDQRLKRSVTWSGDKA
jgi:hypothetical protein